MIRLRDFGRIVFFTGAGLSAESGIPTYRGKGGIWEKYDYGEYACQRAFDRDPGKVWDFHDVRRRAVAACEPNSGHRIIAGVPAATVVTQNIDGADRHRPPTWRPHPTALSLEGIGADVVVPHHRHPT